MTRIQNKFVKEIFDLLTASGLPSHNHDAIVSLGAGAPVVEFQSLSSTRSDVHQINGMSRFLSAGYDLK